MTVAVVPDALLVGTAPVPVGVVLRPPLPVAGGPRVPTVMDPDPAALRAARASAAAANVLLSLDLCSFMRFSCRRRRVGQLTPKAATALPERHRDAPGPRTCCPAAIEIGTAMVVSLDLSLLPARGLAGCRNDRRDTTIAS